jgi:hypothetical protein
LFKKVSSFIGRVRRSPTGSALFRLTSLVFLFPAAIVRRGSLPGDQGRPARGSASRLLFEKSDGLISCSA